MRRDRGEDGFTLIEVLVVVLVIGILCAIAIPSFLSRRARAQDAVATSSARSAQLAMEAYATDHDGKYTDADVPALVAIEPTLSQADGLAVDAAADDSFRVSVRSSSPFGTRFAIARRSDGTVRRSCDQPGDGGCKGDGSW